ncbi:GreA/GreB family elongation factor [Nocardia sp. CDC186]|uniref:GreA/GreB family elongation factor n=1 Tax=Nocardia implantans TaxID=3108168 RepID=A0ABU6AQW8_9NOCA|nr:MULTISPECIES: GreA/GreB family elongation factor [unclassified Nocardia]MBF6190129.1 GreA/GreB family elongation factor [Nocardia beijingensis]MEA3526638.1 GreA/GreB family elongation factor [Nocardia sp. CDC192]MEB3509785.1 GreA/GreB family elongation factor [Nocardia sp. CDC186]
MNPSEQLPLGARNVVMVYSTVTVTDLDTGENPSFQIVPDHEADISNGKYPKSAPICQALLGTILLSTVETVSLDNKPVRLKVLGIIPQG